MDTNQPVIFVHGPSPAPHRKLIDKVLYYWRTSPLALRIAGFVVAFLVIAALVFGILVLLNRGESSPSEAEQSQAQTDEELASSDDGTTESGDTPTETNPDGSTPSAQGGGSSAGGGSGSGGSGGSGGGGSGGGSGGGGGGSGGFPSASNTGPSGCTSYTQYSGILNVTTDGTVLNCIELNGTLTINANNVTVQNSILNGNSWWGVRFGNTNGSATNFKLLRSRLQTVPGLGPDNGGYDYGISQESNGYMEIGYNDISGYKDGVTTSNGYIHDNYIHNLSQFTGAHTQDIYVYSGPSQVKIEHNTLINDSPQDQATAAVYIAPDDGHQNDRIVTNNFLAGGAFTIYGGDSTATNIVVTNNQFSTQRYPNSGYYGWVAYWQAGNSGVVWSGNTWADGPDVGETLNP